MNFDKALNFVLKEEGGYVNNPNDSGGATNFGVIQKTYDKYRKAKGLELQSVRRITRAEVIEIYHNGYWLAGRCETILTTHPNLALVHFDACVNCGILGAARILQRALGDVKVDGIIGAITLASLWAKPEIDLIHDYCEERNHFYFSLAARRPKDKEFLKGWLYRVARVRIEAIYPSK